MKKLLNFKNIAIAALIIYVLLQWFNPGGVMPGGRTIRIDGKKYEVLKHTIDTIEVEKTKIVTKKGADIIFNSTLVRSLVRLQLFYYLFNQMTIMDYCKNKVSKINIGYYIFENKKDPKLFKTINNKFNLLVKKYHKKDVTEKFYSIKKHSNYIRALEQFLIKDDNLIKKLNKYK